MAHSIAAAVPKRINWRVSNALLPSRSWYIARVQIQFSATEAKAATDMNSSQCNQILGNAPSVVSRPHTRLPGPARLRTEATATVRQADPAKDAFQLLSLRNSDWSAFKTSHKAGGASSLKTRASIKFL